MSDKFEYDGEDRSETSGPFAGGPSFYAIGQSELPATKKSVLALVGAGTPCRGHKAPMQVTKRSIVEGSGLAPRAARKTLRELERGGYVTRDSIDCVNHYYLTGKIFDEYAKNHFEKEELTANV